MKKLILLLAGLFLASCSQKETVEAQFEFDGALYRIMHYDKGTPKLELEQYVSNTANADKTTYYFYYPKETDISVFTKENFNNVDFYKTVVDSKPDYGLYMMTADSKVYDDGLWILQQAVK